MLVKSLIVKMDSMHQMQECMLCMAPVLGNAYDMSSGRIFVHDFLPDDGRMLTHSIGFHMGVASPIVLVVAALVVSNFDITNPNRSR